MCNLEIIVTGTSVRGAARRTSRDVIFLKLLTYRDTGYMSLCVCFYMYNMLKIQVCTVQSMFGMTLEVEIQPYGSCDNSCPKSKVSSVTSYWLYNQQVMLTKQTDQMCR